LPEIRLAGFLIASLKRWTTTVSFHILSISQHSSAQRYISNPVENMPSNESNSHSKRIETMKNA
jgi:hypothetical protein